MTQNIDLSTASPSQSFYGAQDATAPTTQESDTPTADTAAPLPQYEIQQGDSFWSIAEQQLAQAWGREPTTAEVDAYWRQLINANADRLPDTGNPNLIFAGQMFNLPPVSADPQLPQPPVAGSPEAVAAAGTAQDQAAAVAAANPNDPVAQGNAQLARTQLTQAVTEALTSGATIDDVIAQLGDAASPDSVLTAREAHTDYQSARVEAIQNTDYPPQLSHEKQDAIANAQSRLNDAIEAEIAAGLDAYAAANPDATPEDLATEASRLSNAAQARNPELEGKTDFPADEALDTALLAEAASRLAAGGHPQDVVDAIAPHGNEGLEGRILAEASDQAVEALAAAESREYPDGLEQEQATDIDYAQVSLGHAVETEIASGLETFLERNPEASDEEILAEAQRLGERIQQRDGNADIPDSIIAAGAESAASDAGD